MPGISPWQYYLSGTPEGRKSPRSLLGAGPHLFRAKSPPPTLILEGHPSHLLKDNALWGWKHPDWGPSYLQLSAGPLLSPHKLDTDLL